jgi:hypothetical protein
VLCFPCYRAGLERARSIQAAGNLDTASDARFQGSLPFEPVNQTRLAMLKVERLAVRAHARTANGGFTERRRRAQIAARHAMQRVTRGLVERQASGEDRTRALAAAAHAAELQLPAVWLPFVMSR